MPTTAVLCEHGDKCPGRLEVRLLEPGKCELVARHEDIKRDLLFECELSTLAIVGMGLHAHLASEDGSCELSPKSKCVVVRVTPWGGGTGYYFVEARNFKLGIDAMAEASLVAPTNHYLL